MPVRLTTRSMATAQAIAECKPFITSGSLRAEAHSGGYIYAGYLNGAESELLNAQRYDIDYIVWSYSTPIAWHSTKHGWHKVAQKFSITSTKHQSNLYKIAA